MKKYMKILIITVLMVIITAGIVFASSGDGEHETSIMDWVWRFLNFAILVAILVWGAKLLGVKDYFKKRTELIEKSIKDAAEAKAAAERALKDIEDKLKLKDDEIKKIMESARKSGEADRDALVEDGKIMSERIKEQAKLNIEMELKQAKEELKADAARLAIELAEKKIKDRLSHDDQMKILEESLKKIEGQNG
ncbi:MAG: ATP synthase F0 subunit B [Thermodesulfovibrionales bacterium]